MKVQNMSCIQISMALQGLLKKIYASRSARVLTSGFSTVEGAQFAADICTIKTAVTQAQDTMAQLSDFVEVSDPSPYVPGHPNISVDYAGRAIEAINYYLLAECRSSALMDSGFLPDEADLIMTMLADLESTVKKEPVPYSRVQYKKEELHNDLPTT